MATGRTVPKWVRFYADGYDLSGYGRTVGPLTWEYQEADLTCQMGDAVKGYLPDVPTLGIGSFIGVFDNTATTGLHVLMGQGATSGTALDVMIPIGIRAAPAAGDPVYAGKFQQVNYLTQEEGRAALVAVNWADWDAADLPAYRTPWGALLHELSAETGANTSTGDHDHGAATALGGYMAYQVTAAAGAGDMTATLKVQHSATAVDLDFADLGGCTTGVINCVTPVAGIVNTTAVTTTVQRYTRWQIVLGTATSVTFALSFHRGLGQ